MNITINTSEKTIVINENITISDLLDFLKENLKDYKSYSIVNKMEFVYPYYPCYPVPQIGEPFCPSYPIITYVAQ